MPPGRLRPVDGAQEQYETDDLVQVPAFHAARCNPVTAPERCDDDTVEP